MKATVNWRVCFEMQIQERLPDCGFCRLATGARDDESIQGRERLLLCCLLRGSASAGREPRSEEIRVPSRHSVPSTRKTGPVAKGASAIDQVSLGRGLNQSRTVLKCSSPLQFLHTSMMTYRSSGFLEFDVISAHAASAVTVPCSSDHCRKRSYLLFAL